MKWIDLTHLMRNHLPVYPGDREMELVQTNELATDGFCNHQLTVNMHTGTHIDGPMHLIASDRYISDFPLDSFIGKGVLIRADGVPSIDYKEEYEDSIQEGSILLVHTGHGRFFGKDNYFSEHPTLTKAFAELLVRKKIKLIGMDTPSPDKYPFEIHKYLFEHQVLIAENLTNLESLLGVKSFEVIALPLLIHADSSIARIIARVEE